MSADASTVWSWLLDGRDYDKLVESMAGYFENPVAFWKQIQESVTETHRQECENEARGIIWNWLQLGCWDRVASERARPEEWKKNYREVEEEEFVRTAALFKSVVLAPLPEVLDCLWKSTQGDRPSTFTRPQAHKRSGTASLPALRRTNNLHPNYWRFFVPPEISGHRQWHFPIATTLGRQTSSVDGEVIRLTVELIQGKEVKVILHPLTQLQTRGADWDNFVKCTGVLELGECDYKEHKSGNWEEFLRSATIALETGREPLQMEAPVTGVIFVSGSLLAPDRALIGGSAGGALKRGFALALQGLCCDQRVLVITSLDRGGNLVKVDNEIVKPVPKKMKETSIAPTADDNIADDVTAEMEKANHALKGDNNNPKVVASKSSLLLKAEGIAKYNREMREPIPRIDTVVMVKIQREDMENALKEAKCSLEEIRVLAALT